MGMDSGLPGGRSMPWQEVSVAEQRREFVRLALMEGANLRRSNVPHGISFKISCIRLLWCRLALDPLSASRSSATLSNHRRINAMHFVHPAPTGQRWHKARDDRNQTSGKALE